MAGIDVTDQVKIHKPVKQHTITIQWVEGSSKITINIPNDVGKEWAAEILNIAYRTVHHNATKMRVFVPPQFNPMIGG